MLFVWLVRFLVIFAVLTAIYLGLGLYNRWAERRRLEADYEQKAAEGETPAPDKDSFVASGMDAYERSLRRKLLLGVYLVPILGIAVLVALAQLN